MGNIDSRNERFYNLCGLGKAHLIEKMLESDRTVNTINVNWVAFETQSTPLLIVINKYFKWSLNAVVYSRHQQMDMILLLKFYYEIMLK
jgi:hypothetical protein